MVAAVPQEPNAATGPPRRWHWLLLAVGWTVFAVYGSLVPLRYREVSWEQALDRFLNLPPLWTGMGTRADWVANILLFIPLTFFWMGALAADRRWIATVLSAVIVAPLAVASAVALEFTQIWFVGRTVSRNDILAETIGGVLGIAAWMLLGSTVVRAWRDYATDRNPRSTLRRLLGLYVVGFAIFAVIPLDLTISLTDLYSKYKRGLVLLVPFSYSYESPIAVAYQFFADIATFVPVGAWVALSGWTRLPVRSTYAAGAVGGGLIALAMEGAQLLVVSRYTDTTDIILGSVGSALGAWLVARSDERSERAGLASRGAAARSSIRAAWPWLGFLILYTLFLTVGFLYPFDWTTDRGVIRARYEAFFRVPLLALYLGPEFRAITQLLIRLLLFIPLGVVTARLASFASSAPARFSIGMFGLSYSAAVAAGLEMAQILMPSKIADLTEVVLCFAGAVAGFAGAGRVFARREVNR